MTKIFAFDKRSDCALIASLLEDNIHAMLKEHLYADPHEWRVACEKWQRILLTLRHNIDEYAECHAREAEAERQAKRELQKQEEEDSVF